MAHACALRKIILYLIFVVFAKLKYFIVVFAKLKYFILNKRYTFSMLKFSFNYQNKCMKIGKTSDCVETPPVRRNFPNFTSVTI